MGHPLHRSRLLTLLHIDLINKTWSSREDIGQGFSVAGAIAGEKALEIRGLDDLFAMVCPEDRKSLQDFLFSPDGNSGNIPCSILFRISPSATAPYRSVCLQGYFSANGENTFTDFYGSLTIEDPDSGLDRILNYSGDMLAMLDADLRFIKVNNSYAGMFKKNPNELIGLRMVDAFAHDEEHYYSVIDPILQRCLCNEATHFRHWVEVPDRGRMYLSIQYSPIANDKGEVVNIAIVCQDNTETMRSLDALQQSEEILKRTEKIAKLGGWTYNLASSEMFWTDQMYEIWDVPADFVPSLESISALIGHEGMASLADDLRQNRQGLMSDSRALFTTGKGKKKWLRTVSFPIPDETGDVQEIQGVLQDVTETVTYEKELEAQKLMFETLAETSDDIIARYDLQGRVVYINSAVEKYGNVPKETYLGKSHRELGMPDYICTFWEDMISRTLESRKPASATLAHRIYDGSEVIFDCRLHPELNKDGTVEFLVSTSRDITERVKSEVELQKLEKLNSLGLLAGGIAHDFNNILTMLFGNVSLAKAEIPEQNPAYKNLEKAEEAFARASRLTNQLLTFAKGGSPIKKNIRLKELVEEVAKFDLSGSNVKLELQIDDDLHDTFADQGQLEQVFTNLVINAVQAMPDGGLLQIRASNLPAGEAESSGLQAGNYVLISFEDEGVGIPKDKLDQVFDPYFSTKEHGKGLGLATVYSVIVKHSGHVKVKSEEGKGTRFSIYLPVSDSPDHDLDREDTPNAVSVRSSRSRRILVMDDEEMIRDLAASILDRKGYMVEVADGGEQAIGLYKQSMDEGKAFDCIIMDLTIPGGIGGKEAIGEILKLNPAAKVIVSSGYSDDLVMSSYTEYGFKGVLPKPFTPTTMDEALNTIFSSDM